MTDVKGKGRPAKPAEDSQTAQGTHDFHMGPGARISAYVASVKSFQVIISLAEAPWALASFLQATEKAAIATSHVLLPGQVELGGDTEVQKFKAPPRKRQLFYNVFC